MRKPLLLSLFLLISGFLMAQVQIQGNGDPLLNATVLHSDVESTILHYEIPAFVLSDLVAGNEQYHQVKLGEMASLLEAGCPDVPVAAHSLIIPDHGWMTIEVLSANYQDFNGINLVPSKGNLYRDVNPADVPYQKGAVYQMDKMYPGEIATLRDPYILRDFRGQTVVIQPFQYNPVTKVLRVYYDITLQLKRAGEGGINRLERQAGPTSLADEFYHIYNRHFLNFSFLGINYIPVGEEGKMLVISDGSYMSEMYDFVRWKNQRGIPCQMVDVSTIGTTAAAIKTYVTNYYNTNGLTYLLLVGDAAQIPTNSLSSGHSDNAYAYILGNDHYPEFFVGRFSAETTSHVKTQVTRTMTYEIAPDSAGGWLRQSLGIASNQGPGDDNELDYQHVRNMQLDLLNFTYTGNLEMFDGSQGGNDATGNPTATMVQNAIDTGIGIILYTGHGSNSSWGTSGFGITNVSNLNNYNKWPFVWAVACVNGNFVNNTCLAEASLRAVKSDQPTGTVAFLGSTINQSWDPPMEGQDEMVDILVESYATNIKRTFGGLSMNGCMKMNDTYGSSGDEMTDTWTVFGDPSLQVITTSPLPITAFHQPVAMIGATQFPIFCQTNGAKATLSKNGQILGTGIVTGSTVAINYTSPLAPDTLMLVITAFNHIPYIASIPLIVSNAPYVTYQGHAVNDLSSNNNQRADFGEQVALDVTLENIGVLPANAVSAILRSLDLHVTVIDSTASFGNIGNGSVQQIANAFTLQVSDSVPNGHLAPMQLIITDNASNQWTSGFNLYCFAPELVFDTLFFNDLPGGNGNGKLEPGEVVIVNAVVRNIGGAEALSHYGLIHSSSPGVMLFGSDSVYLAQLPLNTPATLHFIARLDTGIAIGTAFQFDLLFASGHYKAVSTIGDTYSSGDEDWETGNFQKFNWQHSGNNTWTITNTLPYEGTWCARSGVIGNNAYSALSVDWFAAYPDTISFWLKVSCENGSASAQKWDFLEFYIDGIAQAWWDGTKPWMKVSYPVSMGQHTFTWRYQKDAYATGGSDAAWIDLITFPAAGSEVVLQPFIMMDYAHFSDVHGNNDYIINAGELIDISYQFSNIGFAQAPNVVAALTVNDPHVTLVDPLGNPGTIQAGDSVLTGDIMQVFVGPTAPLNHIFDFTVTLTDDSSLTWAFPFQMQVGSITGIPEPAQKPELKLWPNPVHNDLHLQLPETGVTGSMRLSLFAMDGRMVMEREITPDPSGHCMVNVANVPKGTYLVRIISDASVLTKKIIRQ